MKQESAHGRHSGPADCVFDWALGMRRRFGGPGRRGWRPGHGGFGKSECGSVKYDVLAVLAEGPRHGYEIMVAIEERRGFRPSPGSIYPALQMLDDDAFSTGDERAWCDVYARLGDIAKNTEANTTPAARRLRAFLVENID